MFRSIRDLLFRHSPAIPDLLSLLLIIIPVRQLTGYSYPSTIWRLIVAFIPFAILVILVYFVALFGIAAYMHLNAS